MLLRRFDFIKFEIIEKFEIYNVNFPNNIIIYVQFIVHILC